MNTTGQPPTKRLKKTHRGRRSSACQTNREQRNEWYFPGSFAFAWLARNHGAPSCGLDPASDGNEQTNAAEQRSCRTSETTPGSPQERWSNVGGTIEPSGGDCESRYISGWWAWARQAIRIWSVCGEISTRELQRRGHFVARLVLGVPYLGWTVSTWTSRRSHPSSGSTTWR